VQLKVTTYKEAASCKIDEGLFDKEHMIRIQIGGEYIHSIYTNETNYGVLSDGATPSFEIDCTPSLSTPGVQSNTKFITFTTDLTTPPINITTPPDYSTTNSSLIIVSGTTEPNSTLIIFVNGNQKILPHTTSDGTYSFEIDLDSGTNYISVLATDKAGNTHSEEITVEYTNLGPSVEIILPSNTGPFNDLTQIIARLIDNGGGINLSASYITFENLSASGTYIPMTKSIVGNNTLVYNITFPLSNGNYEIKVVPIDNSNNIGNIDKEIIIINDQVPIINITTPSNMATVTSNRTYFNGSISLVATPDTITSITLFLNDVPHAHPPSVPFSLDLNLIEGVNTFYIAVNTTKGYYGRSPAEYVFRDTSPPIPECIYVDDVPVPVLCLSQPASQSSSSPGTSSISN
jgi:hypothetical protein